MTQSAKQDDGTAKIVDVDSRVVVNVWKVSPGRNAKMWDDCRSGYITINWANETNFTGATEEEIRQALPTTGEGSRGASSIHKFVNEIEEQDVVVANNGLSRVMGIGFVRSEYLHPHHRDNPRRKMKGHRHLRIVRWLVTDSIELHRELFNQQTVWLLDAEQCAIIKRAYLTQQPELKEKLDRLLPDDSQCAQAEDIEEAAQDQNISSTTKKALIDARLGQGRFRELVLQRWGRRCAVTSSVTETAIRASHIQPWKESDNDERLDVENGLPLIASLDALFDKGLISFESSGRMIVSSELTTAERKIFGIGENSLTKPPTKKMADYLAIHRRKHGFSE